MWKFHHNDARTIHLIGVAGFWEELNLFIAIFEQLVSTRLNAKRPGVLL